MREGAIKAVAAVTGAVAGLFGGWDTLLYVLCVFMVIDYISGTAVAISGRSPKTENGKLDSGVGFSGLLKKAAELAAVIIAVLMDTLAVEQLGFSAAVFRTGMILYIIATEGLSIFENLGLLGVKLPDFAKKAMEQLQESNSKPPDKDDVES